MTESMTAFHSRWLPVALDMQPSNVAPKPNRYANLGATFHVAGDENTNRRYNSYHSLPTSFFERREVACSIVYHLSIRCDLLGRLPLS